MKKITIKSTVELASSDTEPILWGGYQIPFIRYADGGLYVKFMGRKDFVECHGLEELDPVYASYDNGATWERSDLSAWRRAAPSLPNGDRIDFLQRKNISYHSELPRASKEGYGDKVSVYRVEDLAGLVDGLDKTFTVSRLVAGSTELREERCAVNWEDMPVLCYRKENEVLINQLSPGECDIKADRDGVLWLPVYTCAVASDRESITSRFMSVHLLRSDDQGHTWDYVSSVYYDPAFDAPDAYKVEGFNESTLEILDNGDFIMMIRSGSLSPFGQEGRPIPKMFVVRSSDKGKSWTKPQVFYDYGIHPHSTRLKDGTILLISGRPGVYLRTCEDPEGKKWSEITELVHVPEEDVMTKYYEYTCSNADFCVTDDGRIFAAYSTFSVDKEAGTHEKRILVSEICLED